MSQRKVVHISACIAGVATSSIAILSAAPAEASPGCENWSYPTEDFGFQQDNGITGRLSLRGEVFRSPASRTEAGQPDVTNGLVDGVVSARHIEFVVVWPDGGTDHYYGEISDDGSAGGYVLNDEVGRNNWRSLNKFSCSAPEEPFVPPSVIMGPVDANAPFTRPPGT